MHDRAPPQEVITAAGLEDRDFEDVGRDGRVWVFSAPRGGDKVVLRRRDRGSGAGWLRAVLTALSARFPVPRPLPLFGGSASLEDSAGSWEAMSFLPGREIGFDPTPTLREVGAFLASFHGASAEVLADMSPRPGGSRLVDLGQIVDWDGARTTMGSTAAVGPLRRLLAGFVADLDRVGYSGLAPCVVHGDPTTFNVLANGVPLRPSGLIDLELADVEACVADLAFCLWRSGRARQEVRHLDCERVRELVGGYHSVRPLAERELAAIPVCLRGRGLQMLVKRTRLGIAGGGPLEQLIWLEAHHDELMDALAGATREVLGDASAPGGPLDRPGRGGRLTSRVCSQGGQGMALKRFIALVAVGGMILGATAAVPASAAPSADRRGAEPIRWGPCVNPSLMNAHAQCGFVAVPLDYHHPDRAHIQLAVSRVSHTSPDSQYQGVMLVNPGGPGGSGLGQATLGQSVPNHAGDAYDWIGFDPRGVGSSRPAMTCAADHFNGPRPPYVPTTNATLNSWLIRSKYYAKDCALKFPALLGHMRTTDSARDMDRIRVALGAEKINFYGFSYGTYLGQVYTTLFPSRVRRMVLDSNVDPRYVWYTAGLHQVVPLERNLGIWFAWIARYDSVYHLGTTASTVREVFLRQRRALTRHPAGDLVGPAEWDDVFLYAGYTQSFWPFFADVFSAWVHGSDSTGLIAAYKFADLPGDDNSYAVYNAVACSDARWPQEWSTWARDYQRAYRAAPLTAWNNAWYSGPCLFWPVKAEKRVEVRAIRCAPS